MANYCKYYKYQKYISRDNGQTWNPMSEYQKGGLYETWRLLQTAEPRFQIGGTVFLQILGYAILLAHQRTAQLCNKFIPCIFI